ncbi:DUF6950 family protein [Phaeobacter sp. BS23]|uniref:DUF6950 family protein n=1 Tax=Phaeobacter sp. BS23 TaxID=2907239 RepID=UPI00386F958A
MTQSIKRHSQWRSNLCGFLASVSRQKFRPGSHDCALFAAGAVQAMTGADLAAEYARPLSHSRRRHGLVAL